MTPSSKSDRNISPIVLACCRPRHEVIILISFAQVFTANGFFIPERLSKISGYLITAGWEETGNRVTRTVWIGALILLVLWMIHWATKVGAKNLFSVWSEI